MSVYNGEQFLVEAVESILGQTFKDFEFIIINDGSTDSSLRILEGFKDPRIKIISRPNKGLVASLNEGVEAASADLIARMDADDLSMPDRLDLQVKYFDSHPGCVLLGASFIVTDESDEKLYEEMLLTEDADLRMVMRLQNAFAHGATMYRKKTFIKAGGYRDDYGPTEDYDLWRRIMALGKINNLPHVLYRWKSNPAGISTKKTVIQAAYTKKITDEIWETYPPQAYPVHGRYHFYREIPHLGGKLSQRYLAFLVLYCQALLARKRYFLAIEQFLFLALLFPPGTRKCLGVILRSLGFTRKQNVKG